MPSPWRIWKQRQDVVALNGPPQVFVRHHLCQSIDVSRNTDIRIIGAEQNMIGRSKSFQGGERRTVIGVCYFVIKLPQLEFYSVGNPLGAALLILGQFLDAAGKCRQRTATMTEDEPNIGKPRGRPLSTRLTIARVEIERKFNGAWPDARQHIVTRRKKRINQHDRLAPVEFLQHRSEIWMGRIIAFVMRH